MITRLPPTVTFRLKTSLKEEENLRENRRESAEMLNDCMSDTRHVTSSLRSRSNNEQ